jgi:hypothetical protein
MNIIDDLNCIERIEVDCENPEPDELQRKRLETTKPLPTKFKVLFVTISLIGMTCFTIFASLCKTKDSCDYFTPYIIVIPVIELFVHLN